MIISFIVKSLLLILYIIVSSYVITFGKKGTGLKLDYFFFTVFLVLVFMRV